MVSRHCLLLTSLLASLAFLPGCASNSSADKSQPPKAARGSGRWIYLPAETGSNLPRRVWRNDDGTLVDANTGRVVHGSRDAAADMQRTQSGSFSTSGN